jgi:hypothetical protein
LGQTCKLISKSARYKTDSQEGHLTHKPSGIVFLELEDLLILGGIIFSSQLISKNL